MRIRIQPALYVYLASMTVLSSWKTCAGAALALLVHELGHLIVIRLLGESVEALELTPFGGVISYAAGKTSSKGIKGVCIAAAGPAGNYLLLMAAGAAREYVEQGLLQAVFSSNAAMLCINLLPAFPLDGGRIVFCLGYYVFPVSRLIAVLSWAGITVGLCFLFLAVYGAVSLGYLNCSIAIVGVYLMYCAWTCKAKIMTENLYALLQEKEEAAWNARQIRLYRVSSDTRLIKLVPLIGGAYECGFIYSDGEQECGITESMLCAKMLRQPLAAIKEAFPYNANVFCKKQ